MEVIKCNAKVAMETIGEVQNLNTKSKMAESGFASSDKIVVDQLELNAKNKSMTKSTQTWLNVWGKNGQMKENSTQNYTSTKISIKSYKIMFYAEVCTKDGFFYTFVENIINKKSSDRSCIS